MFRTDDGAALAYDVRGDGLPLVLVNGLPDTKDGWNNTASALAPYFRVVTYNLRNQGLVEDGGEGYQTERHVRDFIQLLAHLRIGQFVGVGFSMGARILVDFAAANPDQALRLALIGASNEKLAPRYRAIFSSWRHALEASPPHDLLPFVETFVPWAFNPGFFTRDPDFFARYAKLLAATHTRRGLGANIGAMVSSYDPDYVARFRMKPIATRTHFVQGEYDFLTPPQFIREMVDLFPHSSVAVIPGCGHNVRVNEPRRLEQEILDFLVRDDELMEYEYEH
ncbi:MAG TPA: alpha/beta hydrolase [Stellaceae bacterium]